MRNRIQKSVVLGFSGCLISVLLWSAIGKADESHAGLGLEAQYSEAVIAFNRQQTDEALRILDQILASHPDYTQALELKALALRTEGKDRLAVDEYLKLVKIKPENERGPYYFEIGVLCYRNKRFDTAREYLQRAIDLGTNVATAHLFLGIIDFNDGNYWEADTHFREVRQSDLTEAKVVARYYTGMIYLKSGSTSRGTRELAAARELALQVPESKMAADALAGINKVMESYGQGKLFGTGTVQFAYDSNISETPSAAAVQTQASSSSTAEAIVNGGIGYMTSPLQDWQWVANYQFNYNYNFNSAVEQYEFFANIASVYINYHVFSDTSAGVKLLGNYTFQNLPNDPANLSGSYTQTKYSFSGTLGPYLYAQLAPHYRGEVELYIIPQDFYTEPALSGTDYQFRVSVQRESPDVWLNPGLSIAVDNNSAANSDFKYHEYTVSLFDVIQPTSMDIITAGFDFNLYNYYISSTNRSDTTLNPHINLIHNLADKWALTGQLSYTDNISTVPLSNSYTRFVAGIGISRAL